jgi:hypothetical protein
MRDKMTQHAERGTPRTPIPRQGQGGEKKALAAAAANRDNPTFKNRRNSLTTKKKTFSNRDKKTYSALPHFRPRPTLPTLRGAVPRLRNQSLHLENRIRRNSLKTRRPKNFNRYKHRLSWNRLSRSGFQGLYLQTLSLKRTSMTLWLIPDSAVGIRNGRK